MSSIDERIVQMQFDNNQFESGVNKTLGTLDKLKSALRFDGAGKGFENISQAAKGANLQPLADSIEAVGNKFNTLGIIGMTAINRLTNSAITSGTRLLKSLTIDQITSGYSKYEQKAQSMQTIMAATGKTLDEVAERVEKLNWFTDETSYSLMDMTNNIGKFTSNGVDLDTSVTAMIGIANAAALAGTGTQEASHAMEGFSKAIAAGAMKTQNWQWIKTARMDTKEFKEALIETAESLGTLTKKGEEYVTTNKKIAVSYSNFEAGLKEGWLTTNVMLQTLDKYGKFANTLAKAVELSNTVITQDWVDAVDAYKEGTLDMAKFAEEAEIPIEEVTKYIEELSSAEMEMGEKAFKAGNETKTLSEAINYVKDAVSTGWMKTFELIIGNYEEGKEKFSQLVEVLYDGFVAAGEVRNSILEIWRDSEAGRDMFFGSIGQIFKSLLRLVEPVKAAFETIFPPQSNHRIKETADALQQLTLKLKDFASNIWLTEGAYGNLQKVFEAFFSIGKAVIGVVKTIWSFVTILGGPLNALAGFILAIVGRIAQFITGAEQAAESSQTFMDAISKIREKVQYVADVITVLIKLITIMTLDFLDSINASELFQKAFTIAGKILSWASKIGAIAIQVFGALFSVILYGASLVGEKLSGAFEFLRQKLTEMFPSLETVKDKLVEFVNKIKDANIGSKIFPKITTALTKLGAKASPALTKVKNGLANAYAAMKPFVIAKAPVVFNAIGTAFSKIGELLVKAAGNLGPAFEKVKSIISGLFNSIASINFGEILGKIAGVFSSIIQTIKNFITGFTTQSRGMSRAATAMTGESKSLIDKIREISESDSFKMLEEKFGGLVRTIIDYAKRLNPAKILLFAFGLALTKAMIQVGDAVTVTAKAIKDVGGSTVGLMDSVKKFFGIPAAIDNLSKSIDRLGRTTITQVATSIALLAGSLYLLSTLDWGELARGGAALLVIGVGLAILSKTIGAIDAASFGANTRGLMLLAGTLVALSIALAILSKLVDPKDLAPKAVALGIALAALAGVAILLNKFAPSIQISAVGIMAMAASMILLAKALKDMGEALNGMENPEMVVERMIELMVALGILGALAGKVGLFAGVGLAGLIGCVVLIDLLFKYLIKFGVSADEVRKNQDKIMLAFGGLVAMMLAARLAGRYALGAGVAALAMAFAIKTLTRIMLIIPIIPWGSIIKSLALFAGVAISLGLALKLIGAAGEHGIKAGIAALAITACVMLLSKTLQSLKTLLDSMSADTWYWQLAQLAGLIVLLDTIIISIGLAANLSREAKVGPLIAMIMAVGVVMAGLALLTGIGDNQQMLLAAQSFAIGMLAFAGAMALASLAAAEVKFLPLFTLAVVAGSVAAGLYFLASWPAANIEAAAKGLSMTMLLLSIAARIANGALKGAGVMLILAMDAVVASLALKVLQGVAWETVLAGGLALGDMMILLAAASHIAKGGLKGAGVMIILAMDAVVASFALRQMEGIAWESLLAGGTALGVMMILLSAAAHVAAGGIAGAGVMFVLAIDAVIAGFALSQLKDMDWPSIVAAAGSIGLVMILLSVAAIAANGALVGAAAMVALGASMVLVAGAFALVAQIDAEKLKTVVIVFAAIIGLFSVLSVAASTGGFAAGMVATATALLEFAVALDLIAVAALGFAIAVDMIVSAFERLGNMSSEEVDRATEAIERFGTAIGTGLANAVVSFITTLGETIFKGLTDAVGKIGEFIEPFITKGRELLGGIVDGIKARAGEIRDNIGEAINNAIEKIGEFLDTFMEKGKELVGKIVEGILSLPDAISDGFHTLVQNAVHAIAGFAGDFADAAKLLVDGLVSGLTDNAAIGAVTGAVGALVSAATSGINIGPISIGGLGGGGGTSKSGKGGKGVSKSSKAANTKTAKAQEKSSFKQGVKLGKAQAKGQQKGVEKGLRLGGGANGSTNRAILGSSTKLFETGIQKQAEKAAKKDATQRGMELGQWLVNAGKSGVKKAKTAVKDVNQTVQQAKQGYDEYKKSGQDALTFLAGKLESVASTSNNASEATGALGAVYDWLKDPVGKVDEMLSEATDTTEEYTNAANAAAGGAGKLGRAAGGSAGGVGKAAEAAKKHADVMEFGKGAIEAYKKMYGETLLVLSDTSPTDAAKKAIMALAEATYNASLKAKEASGVAKEASEDAKAEIDKIAEAYTKLRDSIANTLENQMDMFKKFEYDGEKVTGTEILENMQSNVDAAKRFEVDMKRMAEKGFAQPLMEKVAELGPKGIKQIEAFIKMSEEQVERANQLYGQIVELPYKVSDTTLASWAYAGQMAMQGFADGIGNSSEVASNKVFDVATQTLSTLETTLDEHSPSRKTFAMGENFSLGFIEGIASKADAIINAVADLGKRTLENMGIFNDKSVSIKLGEDICLGLAEGIRSKTSDVIKAAKEMADSVLEATTGVLEINSPSRAFEEIGRYTDLGFANGISMYSGTVGKAAEALGAGAIDHIKSAVEFISALINEGIDDAPTITPVLDLTNLQEGVGAMDGLLNGTSVAAAGSIQIQNDRNSLVSAMKDAFSSVMTSETPTGDITIHVYGAQGQDPRAIAEAVEERLLVKFNRLRAARA